MSVHHKGWCERAGVGVFDFVDPIIQLHEPWRVPNTKHHFTGVCQHLSTTRHKILTGNEMPTVAIQHFTLKNLDRCGVKFFLSPENFGSFKRTSFIQCKLHRNHHIGVSIIVFNNRSSHFDCPYAFTHLQHRNWHILVFRTQNSCDLHCSTVCD